jgi:hypothetical protein
MGIASRPEAKGADQKLLLVQWLQRHHNGPLRQLLFEDEHAEHSLSAVPLVYELTPNRKRSMTARFQSIE